MEFLMNFGQQFAEIMIVIGMAWFSTAVFASDLDLIKKRGKKNFAVQSLLTMTIVTSILMVIEWLF